MSNTSPGRGLGWTLAWGLVAMGCGVIGGAKSPSSTDELDVIARTDDGKLVVAIEHLDLQFEVPRGTQLAPKDKDSISADFAFVDGDTTFLRVDRDASRYFDSAMAYVDTQRMKQDGFEEGNREDLAHGWDADYAYAKRGGKNHDYFGQFEIAGVVYRCQLWGDVTSVQVDVGRKICRSLAKRGEPAPTDAGPPAPGETSEAELACRAPADCGDGQQCCTGMSTRCIPEGECNGGDTPLVACGTMADCPATHYGMKVQRCGPAPNGVPGLKACLLE